MSNEQSIRDELADRINDELDKWGEGSSSPYAIADAISPVIRRIQAEAGAEALRSYRTRLMGQHIDRFGIVLPDLHEVLDDLDEEADRIERSRGESDGLG